jgi:nucleotide-binding universal stress UspA family protein
MKRVLLALERSDDGSGAVAFARSLARDRMAEILLLRVEEWPLLSSFAVAPGWRSSDLEAVRSSLEAAGGVQARILRNESATSAAVVPQARRESASLIVLPYHTERTWMRLMSGAPVERILRESTIPVLAVPGGGSPPARRSRILFAYEDGEAAVWGLRHVIEFAQVYEAGVRLLRLRVPRAGDREAGDEPAAGRLMRVLEKREVPAEVLPDGRGTPLEDVASASRQGCGLVALMKSPKRTRRSFFALARAILQCVPLPVLLLGDGSPTSASHMETPASLRMRI